MEINPLQDKSISFCGQLLKKKISMISTHLKSRSCCWNETILEQF